MSLVPNHQTFRTIQPPSPSQTSIHFIFPAIQPFKRLDHRNHPDHLTFIPIQPSPVIRPFETVQPFNLYQRLDHHNLPDHLTFISILWLNPSSKPSYLPTFQQPCLLQQLTFMPIQPSCYSKPFQTIKQQSIHHTFRSDGYLLLTLTNLQNILSIHHTTHPNYLTIILSQTFNHHNYQATEASYLTNQLL